MKHLKLATSAFENNGTIPQKYTCDGENINPPFQFEEIPQGTVSLVFLVEDPDSPGKTWLHWALFNIPPDILGINENSKPYGSYECVSDFGKIGYGGPCPANGIHRYSFKLFALDRTLDLTEDATLEEIYSSMQDHIIESAQVIGLYTRE